MSDEQEWVRITKREYDRLTMNDEHIKRVMGATKDRIDEINRLKDEIDRLQEGMKGAMKFSGAHNDAIRQNARVETLMQVIERLAKRDETE